MKKCEQCISVALALTSIPAYKEFKKEFKKLSPEFRERLYEIIKKTVMHPFSDLRLSILDLLEFVLKPENFKSTKEEK